MTDLTSPGIFILPPAAEALFQPVDNRKKPRIRVRTDGECRYPFTKNSWLVFADIQAAYKYLGKNVPVNVSATDPIDPIGLIAAGLAIPATIVVRDIHATVYNTQW